MRWESDVEYDLYPFPGGVSFQDEPLEVVECPRRMRGEYVVPPTEYHKSFARINGFWTIITNVYDIVRFSDHVQTERFEEEVKRVGDEAVQLGVAFELDMERYVGEGRWCYLPRLAVSTDERAELQFMKGEVFVEYAAYYYAELMEGIAHCEALENEGHNSEDWSDPDEVWTPPAYYRQYQENEEFQGGGHVYDDM